MREYEDMVICSDTDLVDDRPSSDLEMRLQDTDLAVAERCKLLLQLVRRHEFDREYDKAVKCLQEVIPHITPSAAIFARYGLNLTHIERYEEALQATQQALNLEPNYVQAL
ncbi:MAG: hypothetical protein AAF352_03365, partial [Pseudomonadota bacterium]